MNRKNQLTSIYFSHKSDIFFFMCGILMLGSEIWKQFMLTFFLGNGSYIWWYFPFQLCSIPMYILLLYPWIRNKTARLTLLTFLMCYCLLGGIAVFADTSGLHYPLPSLTIHSYLWHILLVILGIAAGSAYPRLLWSYQKKALFSRILSSAFPLRPFIYSTLLYLACCLAAVLLDLTLDRYGTINMFYINPDYKMQQIIFRDFIPVLGNNGAIFLYIISTVLGAFIFFLIWKLIFRIRLYFRTGCTSL